MPLITYNEASGKLYQNGLPYTQRIFDSKEEAFEWLKGQNENIIDFVGGSSL